MSKKEPTTKEIIKSLASQAIDLIESGRIKDGLDLLKDILHYARTLKEEA